MAAAVRAARPQLAAHEPGRTGVCLPHRGVSLLITGRRRHHSVALCIRVSAISTRATLMKEKQVHRPPQREVSSRHT